MKARLKMKQHYKKYLVTLILTTSLPFTNCSFSMEAEPTPETTEEAHGISCLNINQLKRNILQILNFYCVEISKLESTKEIQHVKNDAVNFAKEVLPTILNSCNAISLNELDNFMDETINFERDLNDPLILEEFKANLMNYPKLLETVLYLHLNPMIFSSGSLKDKALYSVISNTLSQIKSGTSDSPLPDHFYKQLSESSINELNTVMFVENETLKQFESLTLSDFLQNQFHGACLLYSLLWGIHENKTLTQEMIKNIKIDRDGNYYFNIPHSEDVIIIPHELVTFVQEPFSEIKTYGSSFHPSKNELIRALGLYVLKRMGDLAATERAYHIYDVNEPEQGDFLLGLPYRVFTAFGPQDGDKVWLTKDGDIIVDYIVTDGSNDEYVDESVHRKKEKLRGDFVLSVSGSKHARSIYYKRDEGKWYLFNNEVNVDNKGIPFPTNSLPLVDINDAVGKNLISKTSNEKEVRFPYVRVFGNITAEPIHE